MRFRFLTILFLFLSFAAMVCAQQPKRVYITLDVSNSMSGNRYIMANYAAQIISVFRNNGDVVDIYYLNNSHDLSHNGDYKKLHIKFDNLPKEKENYHEIGDLLEFMKAYKPNPGYQDWLFIIGDGEWNWPGASKDFEQMKKQFESFVKKNNIQVCFLQTGDIQTCESPFAKYLDKMHLPNVEMRKSDTTASSVQQNAVYFANKILGFSNEKIALKQIDNKTVQFSSEFQLESFTLLYQSSMLQDKETKIVSAKYGKKSSLFCNTIGCPTTKPLVEEGRPILNGVVWKCQQKVPAGETVTIQFDKEVDINNLILYPTVDVTFQVLPRSFYPDTVLTEFLPNFFNICHRDTSAKVIVVITDNGGNKFPPTLMKKMTLKLNDGTAVKTLNFNASDTTFSTTVPLASDTTAYHVTIDASGYFNIVTPTQRIIKTNNCPPKKIDSLTLSEQIFGAIAFSELNNGNSLEGAIQDTIFQLIKNHPYDKQACIDCTTDDPVSITLNGCDLIIKPSAKSIWCECDCPDTIHYLVTLHSAEGVMIGDSAYENIIIPISVPVDHRKWTVRCKRQIILAIALILFYIYLAAMRRKKRFGEKAILLPYYYDRQENLIEQGGYRLRKKGFGPWFKRWFVPGDERIPISCNNPNINITFQAGDSLSIIKFAKKYFTREKMDVDGYDPDNANAKDNFIKLSNNSSIFIRKPNGNNDGKLVYSSANSKRDSGYHLFMGLLSIATIAAFAWTVFVLIKGL